MHSHWVSDSADQSIMYYKIWAFPHYMDPKCDMSTTFSNQVNLANFAFYRISLGPKILFLCKEDNWTCLNVKTIQFSTPIKRDARHGWT
jgi:hypothetical protein